MKEWFRARNVWGDALDTLSDESTGKLMKAVWKYTRTGQVTEVQGPESALFALILFSLEQDEERDSEISRKRAASGAAGGRKKAENKEKAALTAENPKRATKSSAAAEAAANATEAKSGTDEAANATETKSDTEKVSNASEIRSDTEEVSTSAKAIFTTHEASYTTETGSDAEENTNRPRTRYVTDEAPNAAEPEYAVNEAPNAANVANANNKNQNQNQIQNQSQSQNQNQNQKQSKKTNKEKAQEREVRFERFWAVYPRKAAKAAARRAFDRINPDEALMEIMTTAIEKWKKTEQWNDNDGRYIPHPATWLNQRRWEDELPTPVVTKPTVIAQQYAQRDYSKVQEELMAEQDREIEEWLRSCS